MDADTLAEATSAGAGGAIGRFAAFPLEALKIKLACDTRGRTATDILKDDGIYSLYRGAHLSVLEASWSKAITFFVYTALKKQYRKLLNRDPGVVAGVILAYISDMCTIPTSAPIEVVVANLQVNAKGDIKKKLNVKFLATAMKQSFLASIFLSFKPAFELAFYDALKKAFLRFKADVSPVAAFIMGAIARTWATAIIYPLIRVKILNQTQSSDTAPRFPLIQCAHIARTQGFGVLYQGMPMELARGISQSSVMFMIMEQVKKLIDDTIKRR